MPDVRELYSDENRCPECKVVTGGGKCPDCFELEQMILGPEDLDYLESRAVGKEIDTIIKILATGVVAYVILHTIDILTR